MQPWHRLFGLTLTDLMSDTCYTVELEVDLSTQQQLLDILIVHKTQGKQPETLPDGLDNFKTYNLLSYKSHQDTLSLWTLEELISHFVTYRKIVSSKPNTNKKLHPIDHFQLYALTAHYPQNLAKKHLLTEVQQGVYSLDILNNTVRIIVLREVPQTPNNAVWQLFSGEQKLVEYGAEHHHWKQQHISHILNKIYEQYGLEGLFMPYTLEQFLAEEKQALLNSLTLEEQLKIVQQVPPEQRMSGIPLEQRMSGISPEQRMSGIPLEQRLKDLNAEQLKKLLQVIQKQLNNPH